MKIQYLTLDLFIYNLSEEFNNKDLEIPQNYKQYWQDLLCNLKINHHFLTEINKKNPNQLDFNYKNLIDGCYIFTKLDDTDCLEYCCSFNDKIELDQLAITITQLQRFAILPQVGNLKPVELPEDKYLGQTWIISGWIATDNSLIDENQVYQAYKALINKEYQYQQVGEFLGATVFEMWRGAQKWDGIEKNSHVLIIFYPDEESFGKAAIYYDDWRLLLNSRYKILWAYEQGRELKRRLSTQFKENILIDSISLSEKNLQQLKAQLQTNSSALSKYVTNISLLQIQKLTVEANWLNYQQIINNRFPKQDFIKEFSTITRKKYLIQLQKDYLSCHPGLAILEDITDTIRGMVEIEQAQRDRNLTKIVAIASVGLATSQIASSIIIVQERPPENIPFFLTKAFMPSIGAGMIASFIVFLIMLSLSCLKFKISSLPLYKKNE